MSEARLAVEMAERDSYATLVACLTSRCQDLMLAEDAMGDALEAALRRWPVDGVPDNPEAWLLTVARRSLIDSRRRATTRLDAADCLRREAEEWAHSPFTSPLSDRRLELMFACVQEQIEPAMRTPLMLQAVLGLQASTIAAAFLVKPATMAQRLVRATRRIRKADLAHGIGVDVDHRLCGGLAHRCSQHQGKGYQRRQRTSVRSEGDTQKLRERRSRIGM